MNTFHYHRTTIFQLHIALSHEYLEHRNYLTSPSLSPQENSLDNSLVTFIRQLTEEKCVDNLTLQIKPPPPRVIYSRFRKLRR